jgi:mannose-6-phosphate isomerase-like protein (cupin superfamily)
MKGYKINLERSTKENTDYRRVLYTSQNLQLVLMNISPGEEIGEEVHDLDQFIRLEEGVGIVILDDEVFDIRDDDAVIIPKGVAHNIKNTGSVGLKFYTLYSPPEHKDGIVHRNKIDEKEDHYDGKTTEDNITTSHIN